MLLPLPEAINMKSNSARNGTSWGPLPSTLELWLTWFRSSDHNCSEFLSIAVFLCQKAAFHGSPLHPLDLTLLPPDLLRCSQSLTLEKQIQKDVQFRNGHAVSSSKHLDLLWVLVLTTAYCKRLLWLSLWVAQMHDCKHKYSESSLMILGKIKIVGFPLRTYNITSLGHLTIRNANKKVVHHPTAFVLLIYQWDQLSWQVDFTVCRDQS